MYKQAFILICLSMAIVVISKCDAQTKYQYLFQNPELAVEKRIDNLISQWFAYVKSTVCRISSGCGGLVY